MDTRQFEKILAFIQDELGDITVQQLRMLLYIVNNEGCPQIQIATDLNMPEPTVSRNISKLSSEMLRAKGPSGQLAYKEGRGLLKKEVDDLSDIRRNVISLSRKGQAFKQRLERLLN